MAEKFLATVFLIIISLIFEDKNSTMQSLIDKFEITKAKFCCIFLKSLSNHWHKTTQVNYFFSQST